MDADFVRDRITRLRIQKGVSEYKMSYDLGHSRGYINNISSGKTRPSMTEFFGICEYFGITPEEFFSENLSNPILSKTVASTLTQMDEDDLKLILHFAQRLLDK